MLPNCTRVGALVTLSDVRFSWSVCLIPTQGHNLREGRWCEHRVDGTSQAWDETGGDPVWLDELWSPPVLAETGGGENFLAGAVNTA